MFSNETKKKNVMNNIVECMNSWDEKLTLSELKSYQYIDLKNKIFSVYINKVIHDYKTLLNTDKELDSGLLKSINRNPVLYIDNKYFERADFNIIYTNTNAKTTNEKKINCFFKIIGINDEDLKKAIKYLYNNIVQIDITYFFHLYYSYTRLNKSLNYSPIIINSGFKENDNIKYYFNTKKKYLIIKSYVDFITYKIDSPLKKIITYYTYIDINTFLKKKGFYLFFKINKFYEDNIKNIALNKNYHYLQYFNNEKKNKDFYILSFNENAKNYTENDSNNLINKIIELDPSVLIICTQESISGTTKHFQKILQKRLEGTDYKLISHRDESKTAIKLGNKNVRTYFYVNMNKINFGDAIKKKFKTIGKKRLYIFENRNVTEQEWNDENKSIELISYEWKRSKESFGYKYANIIGRVLKGTIYKGAICLKITLKYNGSEYSFIIVNTNFSADNKKKDQFDNVCKEFNLENEIDNSTIFFCGDLNFNIDNNKKKNELNNYIKNHIVLYQNVSDKMKNLYKKFLDCINSIDIKIRLPNRIIYAISEKDKYDIDINKDNFGSIQIKDKSNMTSFEFSFIKNNGNKLNKLIKEIPNIRTVQNLKNIANLTANMNITNNFENKYRNVLKILSSKANKNILPNLSGLKDIFKIMTDENLDEFIFLGNYDYGYNKYYTDNKEKRGNIFIYKTILNINNKIDIIENYNNKSVNEKINFFKNKIDNDRINIKNDDFNKIFFLTSRKFLLGFDDFINNYIEKKNNNYSFRKNIETKIDKLFFYLYFNNSLFFCLKEIVKVFIKPNNQLYYNKNLIPPLYSVISIILYDFKNNKFYTFIKPIQDSINFTNFLLNNRNFNIYSHKIEYLKNNIINNYNNKDYKKYYSIKDNNIYLANRYIKKDFYLVSFKDDNNNHNNLIKNISAQICLENPLFVIIFIENSKNFINNMKEELNIYDYEIYKEHKLNNISISIFINSFYKKNSLNKNNSINCQYIDNDNNNFIKLKLQIFIDNEKYNLSFILCKEVSKDIISSNDTFIIGNLSNENMEFISKYNKDTSIYKTDTFNEFKDNTKLYEIFNNTEYLNSIETLRIHPENRIVYNNDYNIYVNPYDLNFYDNIETLSFRLVRNPYPENYKEIFNIILAKIFFIQSIIKEEIEKSLKINNNKKKLVTLSTGNINKRIKNYKKEINNIKQSKQNIKLPRFVALIKSIIKLRYTTEIIEKSKGEIDNFIKEINRFVFDTFVDTEKIMDFFASDIDDVYKFKIGELLYYYNLLDKESEIRKLKYYPYS
jgi:hypothetical protein